MAGRHVPRWRDVKPFLQGSALCSAFVTAEMTDFSF